jgi:subtilase family serine protease
LKHRIVLATVAALAVAVPSAQAANVHSRNVCGPPTPGSAHCHAKVVTDGKGDPLATAGPAGLNPVDLQAAYALPSATAGAGKTIAIVDAYDLPTAQNDLNVYRAAQGLPVCQGTCFRKVNQTGGTTPPRANASWGQEIALDIDMASAICPLCNILLVEANSAAFNDLGTAVQTAKRLGASVISNSYGGPEFSQETTGTYASAFVTGVPTTVSTGDSGYEVEYPAAAPNVIAVGGTSLRRTTGGRGWTETAWSGAGSGCSIYVAKPSWQTSATGCAKRAVADVSAVADPNTGVSVYDSTKYQGRAGWMVFGGTSASAPIVAATYALAGNNATPAYTWGHASSLFDITSGSNGTCSTAQWCKAGTGWDGPTGLGTPNGLGAF